ncbi:MAG: glycosyltransferase family 4 protein [Micrococcales bacterium]|nr:glycosyltransferase family 4 protein [Micrococcales bacterium]
MTATIPMTVDAFQRELIRQLCEHNYEVTVVSSPGGRLWKVADDLHVKASAIGMTRALSPGRDALALVRWIVLLVRLRPQLVVSATPKASLLAMVAARLTGVPRRLYSAVGLRLEGEEGWRRTLLIAMERITAGSATTVVPNSPSLAAKYRDLALVDPSKIHPTVPASSHGVDTQYFTPRERDLSVLDELGLDPSIPIAGFVGRLTHDKGIDDLVAAVTLVHGAKVPFQLLVVGPQDEADSARYSALLRGCPVPVATVDEVSDVRPYYSCMDVHVLPTLREGFPNVVLEAAAMGVPTVTTRATGAIDSVDDDVTGRLVEVSDPRALARAMSDLLSDRTRAQQLGHAAREKAVRAYEPRAVVRSHLRSVMTEPAGVCSKDEGA